MCKVRPVEWQCDDCKLVLCNRVRVRRAVGRVAGGSRAGFPAARQCNSDVHSFGARAKHAPRFRPWYTLEGRRAELREKRMMKLREAAEAERRRILEERWAGRRARARRASA